MNFTKNLDRLDEILNRLEEENTPLDEALAVFEQGVTLVRELQEFLENAEQKVTLLTRENKKIPFETFREQD